MVCGAFVTAKVWVTDGAAVHETLPAWLAVIEQVPPFTRVTVPEETVQTVSEFDVKATVSPELAVAVRAKDPVL